MALIITLILLGILLILVEMLLIPGVGIAGFLGLASLAGSCYYAFVHFNATVGTIVTIINVFMVMGMLFYALQAKTWKKLSLDTAIDTKTHPETRKIAVGDKGKAVTRLAPIGTARIGDITCEVKSIDNIINAGTSIEVVLLEDNKIIVKPCEPGQDNIQSESDES